MHTSDISVLEAGAQDRADEAAPDLADFYRGINATNENGSDVHLSAFGHSYGSVATAQALTELGRCGSSTTRRSTVRPGSGTPTRRSAGVRWNVRCRSEFG